MPKPQPGELVQGTLDMLILKTLSRNSMHGYGIAQLIQQISEDVLRVEEGSLYPALHRLELDGLLEAEWGQSENNRRAKYYRLTARSAGQKYRARSHALCRWREALAPARSVRVRDRNRCFLQSDWREIPFPDRPRHGK